MAITSGASHALAAFSTVLIAAFMKVYLGAHADLIRAGTEVIGAAAVGIFGGPIDDEFAGVLVVATGLSFLWGVGYHLARH